MRKVVVIALFLLGIVFQAFSEDRRELIAQDILKSWTAQGMTIKTGFEADGTQIVVIFAQADFGKPTGYFPLKLTAKAGVKSILRVYTNKTNGCSRSFILPQLKVQAILDPTGVKEFPLPPIPKGTQFVGFCGMGMYSFRISFL